MFSFNGRWKPLQSHILPGDDTMRPLTFANIEHREKKKRLGEVRQDWNTQQMTQRKHRSDTSAAAAAAAATPTLTPRREMTWGHENTHKGRKLLNAASCLWYTQTILHVLTVRTNTENTQKVMYAYSVVTHTLTHKCIREVLWEVIFL